MLSPSPEALSCSSSRRGEPGVGSCHSSISTVRPAVRSSTIGPRSACARMPSNRTTSRPLPRPDSAYTRSIGLPVMPRHTAPTRRASRMPSMPSWSPAVGGENRTATSRGPMTTGARSGRRPMAYSRRAFASRANAVTPDRIGRPSSRAVVRRSPASSSQSRRPLPSSMTRSTGAPPGIGLSNGASTAFSRRQDGAATCTTSSVAPTVMRLGPEAGTVVRPSAAWWP